MPKTAAIDRTVPEPLRSEVTSFGVKVCGVATLEKMEVGDSFVVDSDSDRRKMYALAQYREMNLRTEKQGERFRVWRTK